jgi:putative tryptophan/tyrosine transport system substrate-binding protein
MKRREFFTVLSGAVVWSVAAGAQQPTMPAIGFLSSRSPDESKHLLAAFHRGLSDVGFVEGTNIAVEYRWALGEYEKLPALAADLVKRRVVYLGPVPIRSKQDSLKALASLKAMPQALPC